MSGTAGYSLGMVSKSIKKALDEQAYPIVYFHGGNEYDPFPSPKKTELYRHFIDIGAKAVIAMHTHCPQGYEVYNGCPIIYSMGNFFFPGRGDKRSWYSGYMTMLNIDSETLGFEIIPYKFDFERLTVLKGEELESFNRYISFLSEEIKIPEKIQAYFDAWCVKFGVNYAKGLMFTAEDAEDYDAEGIKKMKNVFSGEAHNELVTNTFKIIYEGRAAQSKPLLEKIRKLQDMEL